MASRPLRVLHVFRTYIPDSKGGAQEVIRQICLSTSRLGVENRVFTPSPCPRPARLELDGATIVRVKLNLEIASCGFCFTGIGEFRRQVAWADVIHYHFPWPFQDILHFVTGVNKPTLLTYHADITRQQSLMTFYAPIMKRFLDTVDRIVCTTDIYKATSEQLIPRHNKVDVIPIGLDPQTYPVPTDDEVASWRQRCGENFFLFVGMLRYYKGLHVLLEACKGRDFKVVIAGKGPLEAALRQQASELQLDNVLFTGEVSNSSKVALLRLCRGIVFPSHMRAEAFGVTLLEGAMFDKPLITAETGSGTSHVNVHEETGLIVPAEDADALAAAMDSLHRNDALASRLGQGARRRFEALFTASIMGERYVETYQRLSGAA